MRNFISSICIRSKRRSTPKKVSDVGLGISGPFAVLDQLNNLNEEIKFKNEMQDIFKKIQDSNVEDAEIVFDLDSLLKNDLKNFERIRTASIEQKFECLLREELVNFIRLNGVKFENESYSLLHLAAKNKRDVLCEFLIDKIFINPNIQSKSKQTPLHLLIRSFETDKMIDLLKLTRILKIFIERNCDLNLQDDMKLSLLHLAVAKPNSTALAILINQHGINLEIEDENKKSPLELACQIGNEEFTNLLIKKTSPEILFGRNKPFNTSPIYLTCSEMAEKYQTFKRMLDKLREHNLIYILMQNKVDENNKTLLEVAIEKNHFKIVDAILAEYNEKQKQTADINGNLIIHTASKYGNKELFELLVKHDAVSFKTNLKNENALHLAAFYNRFEFIRALLDYEKKLITNIKPMVQIRNKNRQTPLQTAIMRRHEKCVKELVSSEHTELDVKDLENNYSIYHLCVIHSNFESLDLLLGRKEKKFNEPLFFKSKQDETPFHLASKTDQIDIIKLIIERLNDSSIQLIEPFLRSQNKEGRTCFHLACIYGHYNIMEYFLNDLKINYFLEIPDNDLNTCLLLSAIHGNERIVEILLSNGANINAKNKEKLNALEISCRKGYFEMAKTIIHNLDSNYDINVTDGPQSLLHMASTEGAHEVVGLLLSLGAQIDSLDENGKNCLDIAIDFGYEDVIRVLLNDIHWTKLFDNSTGENLDKKKSFYLSCKESDYIFDRQIDKMTDKKMWDMIKIVLDNCHLNKDVKNSSKFNSSFDFRVLDSPSFKNLNSHPLIKIANSGQEQLLVHETIRTLLDLKWRKIPRIFYYFNLLIHLAFLIMFTIFSLELLDLKKLPENNNKITDDDNYDSKLDKYLIAILSIIIFKMLIKIILAGIFAFFLRVETLLEIVYVVLAFLALQNDDLKFKINYCTIVLITMYFHYALLIQKLRYFGAYVLAFKGTIKNCIKFFPVFFLIFLGFVFSFRIRTSTSDLSYFNGTTSDSLITGLTLMMGNFKDEAMGTQTSSLNYALYYIFIILISIIILNLFAGIAVGEITELLTKATVQQISMRIIYVLQVQNALRFTNRFSFLKKVFNMCYSFYDYDLDESKLAKFLDRVRNLVVKKLEKSSPHIELVDPNLRLEQKIDQLYEHFSNECIKIKNSISIQLNYVESKMAISQRRIIDNLQETGRKALHNIDQSQDQLIESDKSSNKNLTDLSQYVTYKLESIDGLLMHVLQSFEYNLYNQNLRLVNSLNTINNTTDYLRDLVSTSRTQEREEFQAISNNFLILDEKLLVFQALFENLETRIKRIEDSEDARL